MSAPLDIHPENIINMFCEECGADFNIELDSEDSDNIH